MDVDTVSPHNEAIQQSRLKKKKKLKSFTTSVS